MGTAKQAFPAWAERVVAGMVAAQQMAGADPSEMDIELARRQAAGKLTGDEAVAEARAAVRARFAAR